MLLTSQERHIVAAITIKTGEGEDDESEVEM
jgi:hypothetical protein